MSSPCISRMPSTNVFSVAFLPDASQLGTLSCALDRVRRNHWRHVDWEGIALCSRYPCPLSHSQMAIGAYTLTFSPYFLLFSAGLGRRVTGHAHRTRGNASPLLHPTILSRSHRRHPHSLRSPPTMHTPLGRTWLLVNCPSTSTVYHPAHWPLRPLLFWLMFTNFPDILDVRLPNICIHTSAYTRYG